MSGRIPQSFLNELVEKADIVDVVSSRMALKKTGKNYSGLCPFHEEKTPSFSVSPDKQFFHCFGCQESGTVLGFIMQHDRLDFVEAVESLATSLGLNVPREKGGYTQKNPDGRVLDALSRAANFYKDQLKNSQKAINYFRGRGLSGTLARDFELGYAPPGWHSLDTGIEDLTEEVLLAAGLVSEGSNNKSYDRFRDRVMFPIRNTRGHIIGFGGRTISGDDGPKYLNSPETEVFKKAQELYGLYEARKSSNRLEKIIVVEGYMDVLSLVQNGVVNTVATLGTATNEAHFSKLFLYTSEIVLCFDGDKAGRKAGWKALEMALPALTEHKQLKLVFLPEGEDPDTLIRDRGLSHFEALVRNAASGLEYLVKYLSEGIDFESIDDRAKFYGLCKPYIEKLKEGFLKNLLEDRVSVLAGFSQRAAPQNKAGRPKSESPGRVSKLELKLCGYLLKHPALWMGLDKPIRASFVSLAGKADFLGKVVKHLEENPAMETEGLLVQWMGEPGYQHMSRLVEKPLEIGIDEMAVEFKEGLERIIFKLTQEDKKNRLESLKKGASILEFKEFLATKDGI